MPFNRSSSPEILEITAKNRVLIIYPHPDDETLSCAGLIQKLVAANSEFLVVSLSSGDASTLKHSKEALENLSEARKREFMQVMLYLGVKSFDMWDFPDSKIENYETDIKNRLKLLKQHFNFDTVITYEPCGFYGHPDHIALSKYCTDLSSDMNFRLIYSTISPKFTFSKYSRKMAKDPSSIKPLTPDTELILSYRELARKFKAMRLYKSQFRIRSHFLHNLNKIRFMKNEYFVVGGKRLELLTSSM